MRGQRPGAGVHVPGRAGSTPVPATTDEEFVQLWNEAFSKTVRENWEHFMEQISTMRSRPLRALLVSRQEYEELFKQEVPCDDEPS